MCRRLGAFNCVAAVLQHHVTARHGCSGHARFNIPDVPGLRDSSSIVGDLYELDSAVVIYLSDHHRIQVWISATLAFPTSIDYCHVFHVVRVWSPLSVLTLIL